MPNIKVKDYKYLVIKYKYKKNYIIKINIELKNCKYFLIYPNQELS